MCYSTEECEYVILLRSVSVLPNSLAERGDRGLFKIASYVQR